MDSLRQGKRSIWLMPWVIRPMPSILGGPRWKSSVGKDERRDLADVAARSAIDGLWVYTTRTIIDGRGESGNFFVLVLMLCPTLQDPLSGSR